MVVCHCSRLVPKVCRHLPRPYFHLEQHLVRCDAPPQDLDSPDARPRSQKTTTVLIQTFESRILWDEYGIRSDVMVRFNAYSYSSVPD
jgi:hypothetical protein